jgi:hypothetical protein
MNDLEMPGRSAPRLHGDLDALDDIADQLERLDGRLPQRIVADPERVEQGLAKLLLTLIELLRQLLEKQAIRRIEAGSLTDEQIERMGVTFMKLEQKMAELTATFGLRKEDLNIHLGPLGDLM